MVKLLKQNKNNTPIKARKMKHLESPFVGSDNKKAIIEKFKAGLVGKKLWFEDDTRAHCGKVGHKAELILAGNDPNCSGDADVRGYEMKTVAIGKVGAKASSKKTTLGDYSASEYAFSKKGKRTIINSVNGWCDNANTMTRKQFIGYFGTPNVLKGGRNSWSGSCVPRYGIFNECGQILRYDSDDIETANLCISYSYVLDQRADKEALPEWLKCIDCSVLIATWSAKKLRAHIDRKFGVRGFFMVGVDRDCVAQNISFGSAFSYAHFVSSIKCGKIVFDSGMYDGNARNYSMFRGVRVFWNRLIVEEFV